MTFAPTPEQDQLRSEVRRFLAATSSSAGRRELIDAGTGIDRQAWQIMAGQLGLPALAIPEEYGGAGFSFTETGIVFEEMGYALAVSPYFSSIGLAASLLMCSGDEAARKDLLPGLADGSVIGTAALADEPGDCDPDRLSLQADHGPGGWRLNGSAAFVTDGMTADLIIVPARTDGGVSLFALDGDAPGVGRRPMSALDLTRPLAGITCSGAAGRLIGAAGRAQEVLRSGRDRAIACLAAEQAGGARRCLDMAVEYAKTRIQFGRPIGSFQAIKHKCADMLLLTETARSAAYYANWAIAEDPDEVPLAVALAGAYCADAYFAAAAENIQIHGGIGFTWEHDAHLFFRRAKSSQLLFGSPDSFRDRLAGLGGYQ
jgi:alkylation response protein AidB-like acyl-CoA dehydrogenase